uniref:Uncharacterized protein n=1 Tax=Arundo donax TaxID=35708 RepID=A0A0A9EIK4_ARUDO
MIGSYPSADRSR